MTSHLTWTKSIKQKSIIKGEIIQSERCFWNGQPETFLKVRQRKYKHIHEKVINGREHFLLKPLGFVHMHKMVQDVQLNYENVDSGQGYSIVKNTEKNFWTEVIYTLCVYLWYVYMCVFVMCV